MINIILIIFLALTFFASITALINTHKILRDLTTIKDKLGIKEDNISSNSFFKNDLDKD